MTPSRLAFLAALLVLAPPPAHASQDRSAAVTRAFRAVYFCPSTGEPSGPCPGFTIDRWVPLCAGGEDAVGNLWWEETPRSLIKDRYEA